MVAALIAVINEEAGISSRAKADPLAKVSKGRHAYGKVSVPHFFNFDFVLILPGRLNNFVSQ